MAYPLPFPPSDHIPYGPVRRLVSSLKIVLGQRSSMIRRTSVDEVLEPSYESVVESAPCASFPLSHYRKVTSAEQSSNWFGLGVELTALPNFKQTNESGSGECIGPSTETHTS